MAVCNTINQDYIDITCNIIYNITVASYRAVIDTSVFIAALRSRRGASNLLLRSALQQRVEIALSVPLVLEYEAVGKKHSEHIVTFNLRHFKPAARFGVLAIWPGNYLDLIGVRDE